MKNDNRISVPTKMALILILSKAMFSCTPLTCHDHSVKCVVLDLPIYSTVTLQLTFRLLSHWSDKCVEDEEEEREAEEWEQEEEEEQEKEEQEGQEQE